MLFNSYVFILLFLPLALLGYFFINRTRQYKLANLFLIGMSLWFYGYFNPSYLFIIVGSIAVNYIFCRLFYLPMSKTIKRLLLIVLLLANIGVLFWYKYFDFFVTNINVLFSSDFNLLHLILPLGISFFTFQQLSYVIDCYKGLAPKYSFSDYALFVCFFPQLIAGPIVLHSEVIPQFEDHSKRSFNSENFAKGITAFAFGLVKKMFLADTFGIAVNWGYQNISALGTVNAFLVILAYTFQIYFDFSGYCDMATGIGLMFNIKIPMNFDSPYKSKTVAEFWKRWHITLTRFFTTYIYIPLGGNRKGRVRTYVNMFIVFFVSGLWHGANWTFILWGVMHGLAVIFCRMFKRGIERIPAFISWAATFAFINLTWVYFRAESITQGNQMLGQLFSFVNVPLWTELKDSFMLPEFTFVKNLLFPNFTSFSLLIMLAFFLFALFASLAMKNTNERIETFRPTLKNAICTVVFLVWGIVSLSGVSTFLYFNF